MLNPIETLPKPLHDYILGRMLKSNKTASGIAIPDGAQVDNFNRMVVVDIGPGRIGMNGEREPIDVNIGDHVLCIVRDLSLPPIQCKIDGETYCLITSRELIATVGAE